MKLVRFEAEDGERAGILEGDSVVDVGAEVVPLLLLGETGVERARAAGSRRALESVKLLAPIDPPAVICAGQNYHAHIDEKPGFPFEWGGPAHFFKLPQTVIGPEEPILYPRGLSTKLDYEAELAVVIGRGGREIQPDHAFDHVAGYTVINDLALREWQVRLLGDGSSVSLLGMSKNFDTAAPLGPWIVTPEEIPDPHALRVQCVVNGIVRQDDNTANLVRGIPELIEFFSRFITLRPGTVIATGACGGTGWGMDPELGGVWPKPEGVDDPYLHPGDRVDCIVEGVGTLSNPVT